MQKNNRRNSIPDLRKKTNYIEDLGFNYISLTSCIVMGVVLLVIIASIVLVAGAPNSNIPAGI